MEQQTIAIIMQSTAKDNLIAVIIFWIISFVAINLTINNINDEKRLSSKKEINNNDRIK